MDFAASGNTSVPKGFKGFQHCARASQNAYKRTAVLVTLIPFLRKGLQMINKQQVPQGFRGCVLPFLEHKFPNGF